MRGELNDFEKKILQADLHTKKKIPTQHQCRAVGSTVYDQYHHFNFSFVSIILENVDEF